MGRHQVATGVEEDLGRSTADFHSLVLDGVYAPGPEGALRLHPLPPSGNAEVERVVARVARRIARLLERRGHGPEANPTEADALAEEEPLLGQLYGASVAGRIATRRRAGRPVVRVGDCIDPEDLPALEGERCASASGVSLHANVALPARDRRRLERPCRYAARPPVATDRLSRLEDGRLLYRLKHRWQDATTHVVFEPRELLEKLPALAPPPPFHLVRYRGIFGPCAGDRDRVMPGSLATEEWARPSAPEDSVDRPGQPPSHPAGAGTASPAAGRGGGERRRALAKHAEAAPRPAKRPACPLESPAYGRF